MSLRSAADGFFRCGLEPVTSLAASSTEWKSVSAWPKISLGGKVSMAEVKSRKVSVNDSNRECNSSICLGLRSDKRTGGGGKRGNCLRVTGLWSEGKNRECDAIRE